MKISREEYAGMVRRHQRPSPMGRDLVWAFLTGGAICAFGQALRDLFLGWGLDGETAGLAVSVCLIFLSALSTALGVYDRLAKHAGAGTLVPITGFANAVAAPALEFKDEGLITGTGAKMFTVAGPVLTYGITAGVVYGFIYWLCR